MGSLHILTNWDHWMLKKVVHENHMIMIEIIPCGFHSAPNNAISTMRVDRWGWGVVEKRGFMVEQLPINQISHVNTNLQEHQISRNGVAAQSSDLNTIEHLCSRAQCPTLRPWPWVQLFGRKNGVCHVESQTMILDICAANMAALSGAIVSVLPASVNSRPKQLIHRR